MGRDTDVSLHGSNSGDAAAASLAYLNDITGDGITDIVIGAPGANKVTPTSTTLRTGAVYLVSGPVTAGTYDLSTTSSAIFEGNQKDAEYGSAVSAIGDFNDDGLEDFGVGAAAYEITSTSELNGAVFIYFGKANP